MMHCYMARRIMHFTAMLAAGSAHRKYLVTSLLPSSTGVVPTACFTTQEDFRMLGMSLKRLLRRLSAAAPSPSRNLRQAQKEYSKFY